MNTTIVESWYIPVDIIIILCACMNLICGSICLSIIILDKTCHTIPMMLVGNTYLAGFVSSCALLGMAIFALENDANQIAYQDPLCIFRSYLICSAGAVFNCSFLLQSLHRYIRVVYPKRLFYQSFKFQLFLISTTWLYSFSCSLVFLLRNEIYYDVDNQMCQLELHISFPIVYVITSSYLIPVSLIVLVYLKLVRYVKTMRKNVVVTNTLVRARNELKMVTRLLITSTVLVVICFPTAIFILLSFFDRAPKYKFRVSYFCLNLSGLCALITLFQFTDPLKSRLMKFVQR